MRITIATGPNFPVPTVRGGAVQRMWEGLAQEFAKRGHEVTIFAREFPKQAREEVVSGIRYARRGGYEQSASIKWDLAKCLAYALRTVRHIPSGDVVVTNDFWTPAILPWVNREAGKIIANANRFPKGQYGLYGGVSAFAAASAAVAKAIAAQSPAAGKRTAVVPNGIDGAFLEEPVRRRSDGGADLVRIIFAGRIHPEKGLVLLAEALRLLGKDGRRNWECVMMGPVDEGEGGGGKKFAAGIRGKTEGLPVVWREPIFEPRGLVKIYDEGDVFVYPSVAETGESFGLAPLEGMARGLVPLVSKLDVFREYLEPGINGAVFDHRSENAANNLACELRTLIDDTDRRRKMSVAARRTAENFSPGAIADKYLNLFEQVMEGAFL